MKSRKVNKREMRKKVQHPTNTKKWNKQQTFVGKVKVQGDV